jgi:hypothetical protein
MTFLQILGLILLLLPFIVLLTFAFIVDWKEALFCPGVYLGCIGDDVSRGILIKRCIMSSRDYLYLLGVMVLIFAAEVTGHWDYLGHMLDGAVIMFLYLKGKEKL